ncbi:ubiquitin-conjugating enzyme E2 U isoform X9 [Sus scrofa]|uniref:ubiquitin-conjugating enzyme E2 U isoform X9 n=1 Tax=Sus scrofa TaxID=9823 RepID=UPI000A2B9942|nr:ubiquitin-conjugating enzyme E2 U isoform X9 [Sus scrofa]
MLLDPSDQLTRFGKVTQNLRHLPQSELWECEDQCQILCCLIMYSRAYILLQRDFQELKRNNYKGINAFPISEDLLEWEVDIKGLQNTIWQGSFFQLTISFTSEYNFVPPVVRFRTIPFHPNVNNDSSESHKEPDKLIRSIKSVSFNDYFKTWSEIATSKATECYRTPFPTSPDSQTETDTVTGADKTKERWKRKVLPDDVSVNEPWEEEVEDLVAWTNTLDTDALED